MATLTIEKIVRKTIPTKYGDRENIGIKPVEETLTDINGDEITLDGRWVNGFRDKEGETDKWVDGMKIKVQIATAKKTYDDGETKEFVNFRLPEGTSSIVEEPSTDPDDF